MQGETKATYPSASEILPHFCVGGGVASAHELSLPLTLSLSLSSQCMLELSPSFAVGGGMLLLARGNQGAFSECVRNSPPLLRGGGGFSSRTLSPSLSLSLSLALFSAQGTIELFHSFAVWGGASAREGKPFSERDRILPLFCSVGGEASAREGRPSHHMIDFSPSFAVWGGRLLLTRGNKGAFSERDRILPLFCSVGGATTRTQQSTSTGFFF